MKNMYDKNKIFKPMTYADCFKRFGLEDFLNYGSVQHLNQVFKEDFSEYASINLPNICHCSHFRANDNNKYCSNQLVLKQKRKEKETNKLYQIK